MGSLPDFGQLSHAYGDAADIPSYLDALEAREVLPARWQDEPLARLWEALCHQTSTFDASYAALPRLVEIVAARPAGERTPTLHLIGSIVAYQERGAALPDALRAPYDAARRLAAEVVEETLRDASPASLRDGLLLFGDLAACRGPASLARAIMQMESGEVDVLCRCGDRETLGVSEAGIVIAPLEWRRRPSRGAPAVETAACSRLAGSLGLESCERVLLDLGGSLGCPTCGERVSLLDGIAAAYP